MKRILKDIRLLLLCIWIMLIGIFVSNILKAQCTEADIKAMGFTITPWPKTIIWKIEDGKCDVTPAYKDSIEGIVIGDWDRAIREANRRRDYKVILDLLLYKVEDSKPKAIYFSTVIWSITSGNFISMGPYKQ